MSEQDLSNNVSQVTRYDHRLLARMMISEGKGFKESALAAGYSQSVAEHGLKACMADSPALRQAFELERQALPQGIKLAELKPLAVRRLHDEIVNPKSPLGIKAIELAGRFKETDWWVRSSDTLNIGVFTAIGDAGQDADTSEYEEPGKE